jgi:hypothetical protein
MKTSRLALLICLAGILTAAAAPPAPNKDAARLVTTGKTLLTQGKITEALNTFRQAAKAGNLDGAFHAGDILLNQAKGSNGRERVLKAAESCGYLFVAATNLNPRACADLSEVFLHGIGQQTNPVAAYAWMKLASQREASLKASLDQLAVTLNPADVRLGQDLAREYQAGHWPSAITRPVDEDDPRLKVQGMTISSTKPLVIVNSATFAPGDTDEVRPANSANRAGGERLSVHCLEIGEDYVLVAIAGESHLKLLSTDNFASR